MFVLSCKTSVHLCLMFNNFFYCVFQNLPLTSRAGGGRGAGWSGRYELIEHVYIWPENYSFNAHNWNIANCRLQPLPKQLSKSHHAWLQGVCPFLGSFSPLFLEVPMSSYYSHPLPWVAETLVFLKYSFPLPGWLLLHLDSCFFKLFIESIAKSKLYYLTALIENARDRLGWLQLNCRYNFQALSGIGPSLSIHCFVSYHVS